MSARLSLHLRHNHRNYLHHRITWVPVTHETYVHTTWQHSCSPINPSSDDILKFGNESFGWANLITCETTYNIRKCNHTPLIRTNLSTTIVVVVEVKNKVSLINISTYIYKYVGGRLSSPFDPTIPWAHVFYCHAIPDYDHHQLLSKFISCKSTGRRRGHRCNPSTHWLLLLPAAVAALKEHTTGQLANLHKSIIKLFHYPSFLLLRDSLSSSRSRSHSRDSIYYLSTAATATLTLITRYHQQQHIKCALGFNS